MEMNVLNFPPRGCIMHATSQVVHRSARRCMPSKFSHVACSSFITITLFKQQKILPLNYYYLMSFRLFPIQRIKLQRLIFSTFSQEQTRLSFLLSSGLGDPSSFRTLFAPHNPGTKPDPPPVLYWHGTPSVTSVTSDPGRKVIEKASWGFLFPGSFLSRLGYHWLR